MKIIAIALLGVLTLAGCGGGGTAKAGNATMPKGSASYVGNVGGLTAATRTINGFVVTEIDVIDADIVLNANFDTNALTASVARPSRSFTRSSSDSADAQYNYTEQRAYTGTMTGAGTLTGNGFSAALSGAMTLTAVDGHPYTGTSAAATLSGSVAGQITGTNNSAASGTVSVSYPSGGSTTDLFTGAAFTASKN